MFEPNHVFTLVAQNYIQWNFNNYQLTLEGLDKVDVLQPNNYFVSQNFKMVEMDV